MPNYAAITFTAEGATGKQRVQRAVVGRMFRDKQVLAIGGEDPVTILHYGGHMLQVPAGSILKAEHDKAKPAPKVEAPPQRRAVEFNHADMGWWSSIGDVLLGIPDPHDRGGRDAQRSTGRPDCDGRSG